jgi:hypothetical protein
MFAAVEKVRERLLRSTAALEQAKIPYAVVGGNAVAAWVSQVDDGAARNTKDVDILLRREDLESAKPVMEAAGFVPIELLGVPMFLDGPDGKPSQAVHVLIANEKVKPEYVAPAPDVDDSEKLDSYQTIKLESLVRMKLDSYRDKDRTHLRDLIGVGLIDSSWPSRFHPDLAARLQMVLDDPHG